MKRMKRQGNASADAGIWAPAVMLKESAADANSLKSVLTGESFSAFGVIRVIRRPNRCA
jgi:hypothetical protein